MTDIQILFAILGALYLWECAGWLRRGGVAFSTWLGRSWKVQHPATMLGNPRGGFTFAPPFPPFGTTLYAFQNPCSIGPDGVLWFVAGNVNPGWRSPQTANFSSWLDCARLKVRGKRILLDAKCLHQASTQTLAKSIVAKLNEIAASPQEQRPKLVRAMIESQFDATKLQTRWTDFRAKTKTLRWLTNLLFVLVFVAAPVAIALAGLKTVWVFIVSALLALTIGSAIVFARLHRHLWPTAEDDRFTQSLIIALAPATTMRAIDYASRPLLEEFHPLTVAKHFLTIDHFSRFARRRLLDLRHPQRPLCPNLQPTAIATEAFYRTAQLEIIESWLRKNDVNVEQLLQPPQPSDSSCLGYCPRCESQFVSPTGACADCGGIPIVPFAKPS